MGFQFVIGEATYALQVERVGEGFTVTVNGRAYAVSASTAAERPGEVALTVDGQRRLAWVASDGSRRWVALAGEVDTTVELGLPQAGGRDRRRTHGHSDALEAQMPGVVRRVLAAPGQAVERGQALLMMEAMKMEIRVSAPHAGVIQEVNVTEGQAVERGQVLVTLGAEAG
jgi:biotin carboxyl carrier protein